MLHTIADIARDEKASEKLIRSIVCSLGIRKPEGRKHYRLDDNQTAQVRDKLRCHSGSSKQEMGSNIRTGISLAHLTGRRSRNQLAQMIDNSRRKCLQTF